MYKLVEKSIYIFILKILLKYMSNNNNKENKMKEIMQKEMNTKIFSSILIASTISALSAVVAVKIKERINKSIEKCKVNNNHSILCNIVLNQYLEIIYFFILTFVSAIIFGIFFYYIFDKK